MLRKCPHEHHPDAPFRRADRKIRSRGLLARRHDLFAGALARPARAAGVRRPRPVPPPDLSGAAGGHRRARRRSRRLRRAAGPADRRLAAEPDRERGGAAGLLEERRDLLPVAAPRPHRRRGGRADAAHARRRLRLAGRLRRRCRQARPDRGAQGGADAAACLSAGAAGGIRQGAVSPACRPAAGQRRRRGGQDRSQPDRLSGLHLRHHRQAEGRDALRQHAPRQRAPARQGLEHHATTRWSIR